MYHIYLLTIFLAVTIEAAPFEEEVSDDCFEGDRGEFGDKFEGDMVLTDVQRVALYKALDSRNGLVDEANRWPEKVIVYKVEDEDFDADQRQMIINGMSDIANKSCIKFREKNSDDGHHVLIKGSEDGCFSSVGFTGHDSEDDVQVLSFTGIDSEDGDDSLQVLNLSKGCFRHGTIVHEMLHTIGFYHMQSTYDRDDFVRIVWENILPGKEHNFAKYRQEEVTDFGVPYDYASVMHYPATAFSKNGNRTIIALKETDEMGQRMGMSDKDIAKLNKMYCEPHTKNPF